MNTKLDRSGLPRRARRLLGSAAWVICSAQVANAQTPAPNTAARTHDTAEQVVVKRQILRTPNGVTGTAPGGGLMEREHAPRAVQTVTRDYIAKQSPTVNPIQILQMNPGSNIAVADPYGLSLSQIRVRGLDSSEIGWLVEGMPRNDIGTDAFFGNEVIDAENLEQITSNPGSADIDSPTVTASGGLVKMYLRDPAYTPGGYLGFSYGTYKTNREFIRLDTGDIGSTGLRAFFSFSHTDSDLWRGPGDNERKHIDFKAIKDFAGGSYISLSALYNNQQVQNLLFPTEAQFAEYKNSYNYAANYPQGGVNYYKLHLLPYEDIITSAPSLWNINTHLSLNDTPYFFHGYGDLTGATTVNLNHPVYAGNQSFFINKTASGFLPTASTGIVYSGAENEVYRSGNTVKLTLRTGHNELTAGYWYEWASNNQYTSETVVNQTTGVPENIWGSSDFVKLTNGQDYYTRNTLSFSQVNMLFLGDTLHLLSDRLLVTAGIKYAMVGRQGYNKLPGPQYYVSTYDAQPLPTVAFSYNMNARNQFYITGSTNFRIPADTNLYNLYSSTTGGLLTTATKIKSEYSIEEELGYRYQGDRFLFDMSLFNYNFTNRQLSLPVYQNGSQVTDSVNAGGQTSRGVDVQFGTTPIHHLRPYVSGEYLNARIDNNIQDGKDYLPTTGKETIGAPRWQGALGVDYDDGRFFANVALKYVGKQYSTFMDDETIPGFITDNVTLGYRLPAIGPAKVPQIQLNLQNLTGSSFRTGIYSFTSNAQTTRGVFGTVLAGSAPTYYINPGFAALVTVSSSF